MNSETAEKMKLKKCGIQIQMQEYVEEGLLYNKINFHTEFTINTLILSRI